MIGIAIGKTEKFDVDVIAGALQMRELGDDAVDAVQRNVFDDVVADVGRDASEVRHATMLSMIEAVVREVRLVGVRLAEVVVPEPVLPALEAAHQEEQRGAKHDGREGKEDPRLGVARVLADVGGDRYTNEVGDGLCALGPILSNLFTITGSDINKCKILMLFQKNNDPFNK